MMRKLLASFALILMVLTINLMAQVALPSMQTPTGTILLNKASARYPLSNRDILCLKFLDLGTNEIFAVHLDEAGNPIDIQTVEENERLEYTKRYGKLDKALHERLSNMQSNDSLEVWIWLKSSDISVQPIVDFIRAKGFSITCISQYAPLLFAELSKAVALETEKRSDVDMVYMSMTNEPDINIAAQTETASLVWSYGITGNGIQIAVVESDGIAFANPYLADGNYYDPANPNIGSHATGIAGIIESTHSTYKGIAYGAPALLSANAHSFSDSDIIAATEWALSSGTVIFNNSWGIDTGGQMTAMDRYLDHLVFHHRVTVVKSAGNSGGNVTSPGLGWNVITVGAVDDRDTVYWGDDVIAPYSSWRDPVSPHNDREKPEVVAVGSPSMYSTLTASPWVGQIGEGTSFAAPSVVGQAALLMQTTSWLRNFPETVKAVIMASAWHNIEGDSRLSEYDGAGAVDMYKSYSAVKAGRISGETLYQNQFPKYYNLLLYAGSRVRIAIAWDSHPDTGHPPTLDTLQADLDLIVLDPYGGLLTSSTSLDNSYEIVDFYVPTTGTYKVKVSASRFDGTFEYLGFAWDKTGLWPCKRNQETPKSLFSI